MGWGSSRLSCILTQMLQEHFATREAWENETSGCEGLLAAGGNWRKETSKVKRVESKVQCE